MFMSFGNTEQKVRLRSFNYNYGYKATINLRGLATAGYFLSSSNHKFFYQYRENAVDFFFKINYN